MGYVRVVRHCRTAQGRVQPTGLLRRVSSWLAPGRLVRLIAPHQKLVQGCADTSLRYAVRKNGRTRTFTTHRPNWPGYGRIAKLHGAAVYPQLKPYRADVSSEMKTPPK